MRGSIGKSLERGGSHAGEVVLCSGLVDAGRYHRRYMEPRFLLISQYPTSWAYMNIHGHTLVTDNHTNTTIQLDW